MAAGDATVADALRAASSRLAETSDTARLDAELLMAHALGCARSDVLLRHMRDPVPEPFGALVERRLGHVPVAHILGRQEFYGLDFRVTPDTLIPRGDSEVLVDAALAVQGDVRFVLDCGTGTGALLLAVLAHLPQARGVGTDRSAAALAVATENAAALGLATRARLVQADWDVPGWADGLDGPFDLILTNPPYVEDAAEIAASVRDHEPAGALFAGPEGLDAYRVLLPQLPALLAPGGTALVEIGASQAAGVAALARAAGFAVTVHRDLAGRDRALQLNISLGF